jgi:hypothetical protein
MEGGIHNGRQASGELRTTLVGAYKVGLRAGRHLPGFVGGKTCSDLKAPWITRQCRNGKQSRHETIFHTNSLACDVE